MSAPSLPHLMRRGGVLYFRRALPLHLWGRFKRRELKFSLRTRDPVLARIRCRVYANRFDTLAATVERMPHLSPDQIDRLVRAYFEDLLSKAEENVWMIREDEVVDVGAEIEGAEQLRKDMQDQIALGNLAFAKHEADELLANETGKPDGDGFDALYQGILRARAEQYRITSAMLRGAYDETVPKDPLFEGVKSPGLPPLPGQETGKHAMPVSEVIEKYCTYKEVQDWKPKSAREYRRVLGWFEGHVGAARKITDVTAEDVRSFRDLLLKMPKGFALQKAFKDKSLAEIASLEPEGDKLGAETLNKYFGGLRYFLQWCENEGYVAASPAGKIKTPKKKETEEGRVAFSRDQLEALFNSPQYTGHKSPSRRSVPGDMVVKDAEYWLPLVGLFMGMRQSEAVQLLLDDVREEDGIVCIDINDNAGKKLKNMASKRVLPVHPELVRMGFLTYVEERRAKGPSGRLFDVTLDSTGDQPGKPYSKYFGRYLKQIGIKTRGLVYHSFRHSFAGALRAAKVEDSLQWALLGHKDMTTTGGYGPCYPVKVLAEEMAKVCYDVDLSHLYV